VVNKEDGLADASGPLNKATDSPMQSQNTEGKRLLKFFGRSATQHGAWLRPAGYGAALR
jgi:hypothetical protein